MSIFPPFTPIYPFKGFQDCFNIVQQATDQYDDESSKTSNHFSGFDIDGRSFFTHFQNGEENMLSLSWEIYDHTHHILRIKMVSREHETAKGNFSEIFADWYRSHSRDRLVNTGAQSVTGQHRSKQPDASWRPRYPPQGRDRKWPSIIVEVAWSERRAKAQQDMEFWLAVTVALSITVTRSKISTERWHLTAHNDSLVITASSKQHI